MILPKELGLRTLPTTSTDGAMVLKSPVVLVRGLSRSSGFWLDFPKFLVPFANVTMIDLLGTGLSPSKVGRGSVEALAQDLVLTLRTRQLLPCHLVGISLGGMVALQAARVLAESTLYPAASEHNVASLSVLASSARCTQEGRIGPKALASLLASMRHPIPRHREFVSHLVSREFLEKVPELPDIWDSVWQKEGFSKIAVLRQMWAAALFHGEDALRAVMRPTLFAVSRDDGLVSWKNTARLWEIHSGSATFCMMRGAGHDFPTEKPADTARFLKDFFERVEREENLEQSDDENMFECLSVDDALK